MTKIKLRVLDTQVEYEGGGKVSPEPSNSAFRGGKKSRNEEVKRSLFTVQGELEQEPHSMNSNVAAISKITEEFDQKVTEFQQRVKTFHEGIAVSSDSGALVNATRQMEETQMSFNLQYLQLQSQMQNENRSYTAVSNIMKTKHDTVKNSISNIR